MPTGLPFRSFRFQNSLCDPATPVQYIGHHPQHIEIPQDSSLPAAAHGAVHVDRCSSLGGVYSESQRSKQAWEAKLIVHFSDRFPEERDQQNQ